MKPVKSVTSAAVAGGTKYTVTFLDGYTEEYIQYISEIDAAYNEWVDACKNQHALYPRDAFTGGWEAAMKSGEVCRKEDFSNALFILISCYGLISRLNVPGSANLSRVIGSFLDEHVKDWRK